MVQETAARYRAVEPGSGSNVIPRRARPGLAGLRPPTRQVEARQEEGREEDYVVTGDDIKSIVPKVCLWGYKPV